MVLHSCLHAMGEIPQYRAIQLDCPTYPRFSRTIYRGECAVHGRQMGLGQAGLASLLIPEAARRYHRNTREVCWTMDEISIM